MRRKKLLHLAIGAAIAIVVIVPLGAFAFIKSGIYDVAAFKRHNRVTFYVTNETMTHSVKRHAKTIVAPARFTPQQVAPGSANMRRTASPVTARRAWRVSNGSTGSSRSRRTCSTLRSASTRANCSGSRRTGSR